MTLFISHLLSFESKAKRAQQPGPKLLKLLRHWLVPLWNRSHIHIPTRKSILISIEALWRGSRTLAGSPDLDSSTPLGTVENGHQYRLRPRDPLRARQRFKELVVMCPRQCAGSSAYSVCAACPQSPAHGQAIGTAAILTIISSPTRIVTASKP